jgi:hypothetical protein
VGCRERIPDAVLCVMAIFLWISNSACHWRGPDYVSNVVAVSSSGTPSGADFAVETVLRSMSPRQRLPRYGAAGWTSWLVSTRLACFQYPRYASPGGGFQPLPTTFLPSRNALFLFFLILVVLSSALWLFKCFVALPK